MKFVLYTSDEYVKYVLIYLFDKCGACVADVYKNIGLNNVEWEKMNNIMFYGIGQCGVVDVEIDGTSFCLQVHNFIDNRELFKDAAMRNPEIIRQVELWGDCVTSQFINDLYEKAKIHIERVLSDKYSSKTHRIKKYIYDAKDMFWELMSSCVCRSVDSLFLKRDDKEKLFAHVKEFFSSEMKNEYEKYNMPYKCNILLYGKPGTGKTSTIMAIASHLNMNIGLIPISPGLDDTSFIHAINSAKKNNVQIIVLEDVDCLFNERKIHDAAKNALTLSGILNCLDGMYRNEGVMIFMTANNVSFIDDAVLRSNRIDYKLYYDYASKEQIKKCFEYYFPERAEIFEKFYKIYSEKDITISMLQAFFFKFRKSENILNHLEELDWLISGIKENQKDSINMYL